MSRNAVRRHLRNDILRPLQLRKLWHCMPDGTAVHQRGLRRSTSWKCMYNRLDLPERGLHVRSLQCLLCRTNIVCRHLHQHGY